MGISLNYEHLLQKLYLKVQEENELPKEMIEKFHCLFK